MALTSPIYSETGLVGKIVTTNVTATSTTIYAEFTDKKTGDARTPQAGTLLFTLSKDTDRFEIIKADSHSTASGITTITVNAAGRGLNKYGALSGGATGNKHPINSEIGCSTTHLYTEILNDIVTGVEGTSANLFKVGDQTDADVYYYAWNADAARPYIKYDKTTNQWVYANDGASEIAFGGAGTITAGDGLTLTGGDMDIDTTDTAVFVDTSSGAGDVGLVPICNATGQLADGFLHASLAVSSITSSAAELNKLDAASANVTATNLNTLTAGATSNSDALHTHNTLGGNFSLTAGEAIDGSATAQVIAIGGTTFKKYLRIETATDTVDYATNGGAPLANVNMGDVDARSQVAQSFTYTDADAETITLERVNLMISQFDAPTDNIYIEIQGDDTDKPNKTPIANGTSAVIDGDTISNTTLFKLTSFTFATAPTLVSGTKYWIVFKRSAANDAAHYYEWAQHNSSLYASHGYSTYTASTTTWAAEGANDLYFDLLLNVNYNGQCFKADGNNLSKCKYIGFTSSNVADTGSASIQNSGLVTMAGLVPGATYYVSQTAGSITATPSGALDNCIIPVGEAVSTTQLLINRGLRTAQAYYASIRLKSATESTAGNMDIFTELGFKPQFIRITAYALGDANQGTVGRAEWIYTTLSGDITGGVLSGSTIITAQSTFGSVSGGGTTGIGFDTSTYLTVGAVYENGFDLRVNSNDGDHYFTSVYITAYGY